MTQAEQGVPVTKGDILAGKYRVEQVLGSGGMGVVVAAQDVQLGRRVALKFLLAEACEHTEYKERFLREARAAVRIQSEHVARVIDVGTLEGGAPYMVMEFLRGSDFSQLLEERGALPISEAVDYVLQACEAVAEAHAVGIIHRDLKPSNLFLTERADGTPLVKVLDFGISKIRPDAETVSPDLTASATVLGSPMYISPEQIRNPKTVDERTDVWALAVILYELVTAQPAFDGDTVSGILASVVADPAPPLRRARRDAPRELEQMVARALDKDPLRRVSSIRELAQGLLPFGTQAARLSVDRVVRLGNTRGSQSSVTLQVKPATPVSRNAKTLVAWGGFDHVSALRRPTKRHLLVAAIVSMPVLVAVGARVYLHPRTPEILTSASPSPARPPSAAAAPSPADSAPLAPPTPSDRPVSETGRSAGDASARANVPTAALAPKPAAGNIVVSPQPRGVRRPNAKMSKANVDPLADRR